MHLKLSKAVLYLVKVGLVSARGTAAQMGHMIGFLQDAQMGQMGHMIACWAWLIMLWQSLCCCNDGYDLVGKCDHAPKANAAMHNHARVQ